MRRTKHKITFEIPADQQVVVHAQLGLGNKAIMRSTNRSDGQINYRLNKARKLMGLCVGFRVNWRNGNHPLFAKILEDYSGVLVREIERTLVPKIIHPTPKISPKKPKPAPTLAEVRKMMGRRYGK